MMKEWHECEHRKHLTHEVTVILIILGAVIIATMSLLKVRRKKIFAKSLAEKAMQAHCDEE